MPLFQHTQAIKTTNAVSTLLLEALSRIRTRIIITFLFKVVEALTVEKKVLIRSKCKHDCQYSTKLHYNVGN